MPQDGDWIVLMDCPSWYERTQYNLYPFQSKEKAERVIESFIVMDNRRREEWKYNIVQWDSSIENYINSLPKRNVQRSK